MSKLLKALEQIDAKSAPARQSRNESARPQQPVAAVAIADEVSTADQPAASGNDDSASDGGEPFDPLARIRDLNRLLEEALAARRGGRDGSGEPSYVVHAGQSDDAGDLSKRDPGLAAHADLRQTADESNRPIVVASEFADLADRLLAEVSAMLPAVITFVATGPESASSHWFEPLAVALLQKLPGRLLVVEADSDQSQWPNRFGVEAGEGLVEVLQSRATWRDCLRTTAIPRLDLLPRGGGTLPNLAASTAPLVALLHNLKTAYSLVLIAAGAIDCPAAETLAAQSEGAVLTVGLKSTPRLAAERAKRLLIASKARILGAIARG